MSPQLLTLGVLVAVSVCMTAVCAGYGGLMVGVPYQEPTPVQAATQRHHMGVADGLMIAVGVSWLVTLAAGAVYGVGWVTNRKRTRTEEKP